MASVTLDPVRFKDGKLWKARYPSLIDHNNAPRGFQFEPAFHVFAQEVEVIFRIADDENAVFEAIGEAVTWQSLVLPDPEKPAPDVTVELCDGYPRRCRVVWRHSGAPLTALRIACRHVEGGPEPETDAWALTRVEGGVYLAILDRGVARRKSTPVRNPDRTGKPGVVRVVGIDNGRPIYDLFHEELTASLPFELSPEPSFRVHHGERRDFKLLLDLPDVPDICFKTDEDGQVEMIYGVPGFPPESLLGAPAGDERRLCTIEWHHASCVAGDAEICHQGRTANLYAQVENARSLESVDPTVIEPPPCDASGVCTKPRDRGEEE